MALDRAVRDRGPDATIDRIVFDRGVRRTVLRLPRFGVAAFLLFMLALIVWSVAAAGYVFFHDTVVAELRRGAKATAGGYEAQIAALKDEIERVRTRRLVEKAGLDERIAELGLRQTAIEKRQIRLSELAGPNVPSPVESRDPGFGYSLKPKPLDGPADSVDGDEALPKKEIRGQSGPASTERIETALSAAEASQIRTLDGLSTKTSDRRRMLERVYDAVGVKRPNGSGSLARGGPFEPLPDSALTFEARADQIAAERATVATFERGLDRIPLRTPAPGASVSSGFGARVDPFLSRPAFHSGLDFESGLGEPVRATAAGRVVSAGWSGGYGNMVEVDHGGGLSTRLGHLSAILVKDGDEVRIGTVLGKVGSTGRSTGPHVHYETRVNGVAVDPLRFLNAGRMLAAARR